MQPCCASTDIKLKSNQLINSMFTVRDEKLGAGPENKADIVVFIWCCDSCK